MSPQLIPLQVPPPFSHYAAVDLAEARVLHDMLGGALKNAEAGDD